MESITFNVTLSLSVGSYITAIEKQILKNYSKKAAEQGHQVQSQQCNESYR